MDPDRFRTVKLLFGADPGPRAVSDGTMWPPYGSSHIPTPPVQLSPTPWQLQRASPPQFSHSRGSGHLSEVCLCRPSLCSRSSSPHPGNRTKGLFCLFGFYRKTMFKVKMRSKCVHFTGQQQKCLLHALI